MATVPTECLLQVPKDLVLNHQCKCDQGPNDNLIEISQKATKEPGFILQEIKGHVIFYTDYDVGDEGHFRNREVWRKRGGIVTRYRQYCYVLAVQWLPKNRAHLLCIETAGYLVLVKNYNYRKGKGDVYVYDMDTSHKVA